MKKKEKLREKLYQMVNEFVEVCDLDSEYYLVEKNDYTAKIMKQEVRDMASNIEISKAREEGRKELVEEIRKVIKKNIKIEDTEDKHYQIDKGIVKTLGDGEIIKMWMGNEDDWKELDEDLYGGWGWYS